MHHYQLADMQLWQCRADSQIGDYFCHNVQPCDLEHDLEHKPLKPIGYALLGFASDLGVAHNFGRIGAKLAPNIIRQFLSRLTIPALNPCYDCGNLVVDNDLSLLDAQKIFAQKIALLLKHGITPLVLGGGHETAYGHYLGLMRGCSANIAILNFDAHFDLRNLANDEAGNSGTPFRQIYNQCQAQGREFNYYCVGIQPRANTQALYDFAASTKTTFIEAAQVINQPQSVLDLVRSIIDRHLHIYITICLDVFHYSCAPGVSAPQALGISPNIVLECLTLLKQSQQVLGLDIVELNPNLDIDNHTARLAANLLAEYYTS